MAFFTDDDYFTGPLLTNGMVRAAEGALGFRLPKAYLDLLLERNGGTPVRQCFPMTERTSWAVDHIEVAGLRGISGDWGIDAPDLGSAAMTSEWGYPDIGVVICETPSAGPDTVMLDYSACGPDGEPRVVHVDDDRKVRHLAADFAEFARRLVNCDDIPSRQGPTT
jgi:hypothetical protein